MRSNVLAFNFGLNTSDTRRFAVAFCLFSSTFTTSAHHFKAFTSSLVHRHGDIHRFDVIKKRDNEEKKRRG